VLGAVLKERSIVSPASQPDPVTCTDVAAGALFGCTWIHGTPGLHGTGWAKVGWGSSVKAVIIVVANNHKANIAPSRLERRTMRVRPFQTSLLFQKRPFSP